MKKIAVVTGTRAEYSYLKPLMAEIQKTKELELIPIATGMHLDPIHGKSIELVKKDFINVKKIKMELKGDTLKDMALYLADGITKLTTFFKKKKIDIVIGLGDRSETFAAAISAVYLNIPFAHINGGDVSGTTIDESIRHAITKLAHIHFAHNKKNAERIKKMGEEENRIFVTGALTIDSIRNTKLISKKNLFEKYKLNLKEKTLLVIHHPITTIKDKGFSDLKELLSALMELKKQTIIIYPNCDAGSKKFIKLIKKMEKEKYIRTFTNLEHKEYISFMKNCDIMLGNSSSGIIESPFLKIPVINIGSRQSGRERSENIIDVKPNKKDILDAVNYALTDVNFKKKIKKCKNKFGDGEASKKIVKILKEIKLSEKLIQKQITY